MRHVDVTKTTRRRDRVTRDEVLDHLRSARTAFDERVARVPATAFDRHVPGGTHTPKQIVWHVAAYDRLMVERLRTARDGDTTSFDRDRVGWEAFNDRTWAEGEAFDPEMVRTTAAGIFEQLLAEIGRLSDEELSASVGVTTHLDPAWLGGRPLWELIGIDGFEHYPMHFGSLDAAAFGQEA
jgi:hypothetical protein